MKRLILILLILSFSCSSYAGMLIGSGYSTQTPSGVVFSWDMENSYTNPTGYVSHTVYGSPVFNNTIFNSGSYSWESPVIGDIVVQDISGLNTTTGTVTFSARFDALTSAVTIMNLQYDSNNRIIVDLSGTTIRAILYSGGSNYRIAITTGETAGLVDSAFHEFVVHYNTGTSTLSMVIDSTITATLSGGTFGGALSNAPVKIVLQGGDGAYFDDLEVKDE
jgi:hypothetical protein